MTAPADAGPDPGRRAESVDVVVVGGGIAGLAAAHDLVGAGVDVVLLESADHVGGKVHARELGGRPLDVGADSLVARHGAGVDLARRLGLDVVHPTTGTVQLLVDGRLRALPPAAPFGVPTDLVGLARAGVLSPAGLARAALEAVWPRAPHDPDDRSVADVVAARYGQEVVDRLVEPMLGGIYAGRPDRLSVEATTPLVAAADRRGRSLAHALQHALSRRGDAGPVFATPRGLMASLPSTLAGRLGDVVRTHSAVTGVTGDPGGWEVAVDGVGGEQSLRAAAVVFATPAHVTARLLAGVAPGSAAELGLVEHASVAVVALHYGDADVDDLPAASGILVPRREGRLVKAATWLARKWPHLADRGAVLRASVGRIDDQRFAELDDDELADAVDAEVRDLTGLSSSATDAVVQRWPHALPQYEVGHLARIDRVRHNLPAGLLLAGAAYDGIGVSPCVASGRAAAADVTRHVAAG
ncbi:protoporphyrinogen oxidase [Salsipaludibacter albus]|uniref:protoporphyrinogen oxidase n=1 Tax=Salsipaludibacter albus TaxID=2849650 RepID=UPI001EE3C60C|nr:protoporphyrinogen oxidase [Salsipaludibacter albus]MBY5163926.1 protoporphyrinogen oxidase [Salsipaludibacter albus]